MHYHTHTQDNIRTLCLPMNDVTSITIEILVKAGSIYETRETNGISHFLEHMFFKGGKVYTTPHAVAAAVDTFGGEFNAYTANEYAGYYIKCAPEYAHKAIEILADMLVNAQFPVEEMEREKGVVIQEIAMYDDDPQAVLSHKRDQRYYGDTSYGRSTLGPKENIQDFTQADLFAHKNALYTKDNCIIVVSGSIPDIDAIQSHIYTSFADLPSTATRHAPVYTRTLPVSQTGLYTKGAEQTHLILAMPGVDGFDDRIYALNILMTAFGGMMSSRLFQNIREKLGLCYYIGARHNAHGFDGTFVIRAGVDKERFDFAVERIHAELDELVAHGITQEEFAIARDYRIGKMAMSVETSDQMADRFGEDYLIYDTLETLDHVKQKYMNLTLEDVNAHVSMVARDLRYLYYVC